MGFRRDSSQALEWERWLETNRSELVACGLPDFILADQCRWLRFVEHGIDGETGWQPKMLPAAQRERLKAFLAREYPAATLPAELR